MGKTKEVTHVTIRNQNLFCLNCGGQFVINYPIRPDELSKKIEGFSQLHTDCPKTWVEPQADQGQTVAQKALWWISNGQVGMSSKTMWNYFMGSTKPYPVNHPYDPDDFSRCYKLLQAVPEWRPRIQELKSLSKAWSNLADNWDELTQMYELNVKTQWKDYKKIGMYELMEKLIS